MRNFQEIRQYFRFLNNRFNYFMSQNYQNIYLKKDVPQILANNSLFQRNMLTTDKFLARYFSLSTSVFSKSKDRGKEKKKPKAIKINTKEIDVVLDTNHLIEQFKDSIEKMKYDFFQNLSIRSTSGSIEQLKVTLDGKEYEIQELAQISRKPKVIVLNAGAFPQAIPEIMKSIEKSGLNINPQQDGNMLFLQIPKVTKEHREQLSKNARAIFIQHRDEMKEIRNKAIKTIKKQAISEDLSRRAQTNVDALYDKYVKEAEKVLITKQNELTGSTN